MNGWLGSRVWIELADGIVLDSGVGLLIDWMAWFLDLAWLGLGMAWVLCGWGCGPVCYIWIQLADKIGGMLEVACSFPYIYIYVKAQFATSSRFRSQPAGFEAG